jgi:RNA polymerase sigma-70 factor (ECF subfamily)
MAAIDSEEKRAWFRREILPLEPELLLYARRFCRRGPDEAEDLVNEAFARAIAYEGWRTVDSASAFMRRVLKNIALDAVRRSKIVAIHSLADVSAMSVVDEDAGPEATTLARDELRRLQQVVAELSPQARRVFTLKKVYGMSSDAIATELRLSVSTVEKHLTRALRTCSERLAREGSSGRSRKPRQLWTRREQDRS